MNAVKRKQNRKPVGCVVIARFVNKVHVSVYKPENMNTECFCFLEESYEDRGTAVLINKLPFINTHTHVRAHTYAHMYAQTHKKCSSVQESLWV